MPVQDIIKVFPMYVGVFPYGQGGLLPWYCLPMHGGVSLYSDNLDTATQSSPSMRVFPSGRISSALCVSLLHTIVWRNSDRARLT